MSENKQKDSHPFRTTLEELKERFEGKVVTDSPSAAGVWMGFTMEEIRHGYVRACIPVKREMTNPYGNLHGGMMAMIMDEIIGWSVVSLAAEQHYTSLNLNVDFLYAARGGTAVTAEARVIRHGKKVVYAECSVTNAEGTLLARGVSNLIAITTGSFT